MKESDAIKTALGKSIHEYVHFHRDDPREARLTPFAFHEVDRLFHHALAIIQQKEQENAEQAKTIMWMEAERDDFKRAIQQLEAQVPRWIPVEEQSEPPEDDVYYCYGYWIGSGRKQAETAEYLCGEWKIVNNFVLTHWMLLPEPPKEE